MSEYRRAQRTEMIISNVKFIRNKRIFIRYIQILILSKFETVSSCKS